MQEFYFNYDNIYDTTITLNCSEYLPLYYYDQDINETIYFEAYGSRDNYYYIGEHLNIVNISESGVNEGIYNITLISLNASVLHLYPSDIKRA